MEKTITVYCDTAMFEGGPQVRTKLTLDFSNLTDSEIIQLAAKPMVINFQNGGRKKKGYAFPAEATIIVPKPGTRMVQTMSDDEMLALLAKRGMSEEQIIAAIKAKM